MHILDFLKGYGSSQKDIVQFEYRLLCSGELYNSRIQTPDWRKSDITRLLAKSPFLLFVCSHPFDAYPQELSLRFDAPLITEESGNSISMFYPDDEIARDLAAVLTLLFRRLITVTGKVREIHQRRYEGEPDFLLDWPVDFIGNQTQVFWERKPATVIYGRNGVLDITDYNPPALGINPDETVHRLATLAMSPYAEALIFSARLYSLALQQLEHDTDLAYQLLVSSTEATANRVLADFSPPREEMVAAKRSVLDLAAGAGLSPKQAEDLAIEACSGMAWAGRKFVKFISESVGEAIWSKDDLFHPIESLLPKRSEFESVLRSVYDARSGASHGGKRFPRSSVIGVGPTIPPNMLIDVDPLRTTFPPVVWFERVVNSSLNGFLEGQGHTACPPN